MSSLLPVVVIAGRPNAGKSTLFNRLAGGRRALVDPQPGLTRDRREARCIIGGRALRLVDTAGLEGAPSGSLAGRMTAMSEKAAAEADVCLFMIDARAGILPADEQWAQMLHRRAGKTLLLANKCESRAGEAGIAEAWRLGFGEPLALSAEHGIGMDALHEALARLLPAAPPPKTEEETEEVLRLAIIGRPNSGKSTLVNRLTGEEKMLTGPEPGITRDSVSHRLIWRGKPVEIFDTAGMRRRPRVEGRPEQISVYASVKAIRASEVILLLMDVQTPFEKQDLRLAGLASREGKMLLLGLNKCDLAERAQAAAIAAETDHRLAPLRGVKMLLFSAATGDGVSKILPAVFKAKEMWSASIATSALNKWLTRASERHPPPRGRRGAVNLKYMTQSGSRPPAFTIFANRAGTLPAAYHRYLIASLRSAFALPGVPIKLHLRSG